MPDDESRPDGRSGNHPSPDSNLPLLADVLIPRHLHRVFTYRIPPELAHRVAVGSFVRVPFGRTTLNGIVISRAALESPKTPSTNEGVPFKLREIAGTYEDLGESGIPPDLLTLSRLVADYYLSPWGQAVRLIVPPVVPARNPSRYAITPAGRALLDEQTNETSLTESGRDLLRKLASRRTGLSSATIHRTSGGSVTRDLAALQRQGLIEKVQTEVDRTSARRSRRASDPAIAGPQYRGDAPAGSQTIPWLSEFSQMLDAARPTQFLLQASRHMRRAPLLHLVDVTLRRNRRVLIIAPEVARAEALAAAMMARWPNAVEVFHSALSPVRKREHWHRIASSGCRIVVGTRSAVFAPLPSIGLIVIEDEEDPSLKEETEPKYHARTVAWLRAQLTNGLLVLGSAHPSLETYQRFKTGDDQHKHLKAPQEEDEAAGPRVSIVDLRDEPYGTLLSRDMIEGIHTALSRRAGVILFVNRKGFAAALICRECGATPRCPECSVALTFYKRDGRLRCHYCGLLLPLPDTCPECLAPRLEPIGVGTEAVEELTRRLFPTATIARMDRDTSSTRYHRALQEAIVRGEIDILIGTQMLFQGWPLPPVGFVGLVHADAGLHVPDYRAGEQTYHTLREAAAVALPAMRGGAVVLQTRLPAHHVIQAIARRDPSLFYEQELGFRKALSYPPFAQLINLRVSAPSREKAQAAATRWSQLLKAMDRAGHLTIWGPVPAAIEHVRGKHRWQMVVKSTEPEAARGAVGESVQELEKTPGWRGVKFEIDVDPVSMS